MIIWCLSFLINICIWFLESGNGDNQQSEVKVPVFESGSEVMFMSLSFLKFCTDQAQTESCLSVLMCFNPKLGLIIDW